MTTSIDDIRKDIDTVDKQLHDLLMKRAELAIRIGDEKKKTGLPIIQPEREAIVVRRLMERHQGPLQKSAVVRIWRELVSAVSILQQPDMKVAVYAPAQHTQEYTDMARGYFGGVMPMQYVANPLVAISMVRDGDVSFAVLPWPEDDAENPWWGYMNSDDKTKTMRVMVRLPYGNRTDSKTLPQHRALVIGKLSFNASGDDHSFLMLDLDHEVSRARVVDKLKAAGMTALSLYSRRAHSINNRSIHLVEVESFVGQDDPRIADVLDKFEDDSARCVVIGGYPLMPFLKDEIGGRRKKTA
jgi:chorismate mutase-like protein